LEISILEKYVLPMAFPATIFVAFIPFFPEVTLPTCFIPLAEIILREI
jgi:hypothetical protein